MRDSYKIIAFALVLIFCVSVSAFGDEIDGYVLTQMRWRERL